MNQFFHLLFRLITGAIGAYVLLALFLMLSPIRPFSHSLSTTLFIYSATLHVALIYLAYALTAYVIGGTPLARKIAFTRKITNFSIFRIPALILGLGGLWIMYDHYILGHHSSAFSTCHGSRCVQPEILIVLFLIYGIFGRDMLSEMITERYGKPSPEQKKFFEKMNWFILTAVLAIVFWILSSNR